MTTVAASAQCLSVLRFVCCDCSNSQNGVAASSTDHERLTLLLRTRLVNHFARINAEPITPLEERTITTTTTSTVATTLVDESNTNCTSIVQISNRYFSAHVALYPAAAPTTTAQVVLEDSTATATPPEKEDGIVLLLLSADESDEIDTTTTATVNGMEQKLNAIHDQVVLDGAGDLLRVCVALPESSSSSDTRKIPKTAKEVEAEYARRVLWCLDRGYEYIPCCDLSDQGVLLGHSERDKEGFARLVEAIQGTVWSSAVMRAKPKPQQQSLQAKLDEQEKARQDDDDETRQHAAYEPPNPSLLASPFPEPSATTPPSDRTSVVESDEIREEKARQALLLAAATEEENNDNPKDGDGSAASNLTSVAVQLEQRRNEAKEEHLFNEFEGALKEAAHIRDVARSGELSDEERRKRAGDAAVMLMDLLGRMGYDEGDEEEEEVDSDDSGET